MRTVFIRDIVLHQDRAVLDNFNSELLDVVVEVCEKFFWNGKFPRAEKTYIVALSKKIQPFFYWLWFFFRWFHVLKLSKKLIGLFDESGDLEEFDVPFGLELLDNVLPI